MASLCHLVIKSWFILKIVLFFLEFLASSPTKKRVLEIASKSLLMNRFRAQSSSYVDILSQTRGRSSSLIENKFLNSYSHGNLSLALLMSPARLSFYSTIYYSIAQYYNMEEII